MNFSKLILFYALCLMVLSQTALGKAVPFLSIILFIILIFRHRKISLYAFKKILFLNLMVLLAFISGVVQVAEYDMYYFARDVFYFIQAPLFIIIGMYLFKQIKDFKILLKAIVFSSFIITLYFFSKLIIDPSLLFKIGYDLRYEENISNSSAILAFAILFYARKLNYKLFSNAFELLIIWVSFFSIAISFSRTTYLMFIIILIIPFIAKKSIILKMYNASIVLVLFVVFGGLFFNINAGGTEGTTFQSKVEHSFSEIIVKNYDTHFEIMHNWRGYEAFLGLSKYYNGNLAELLFGQGLGAVVITPYYIFQGTMPTMDVLPMFHNGYITILLKAGLVGFLFFFLFLHTLLKTGTQSLKAAMSNEQALASILLQASVFIIFFQTLVVHGLFTKSPSVLLLFLIGITIQLLTLKQKFFKEYIHGSIN